MTDITINQDSTILEILEKLNNIRDVSRLILFVEDDKKAIIGSLTDGDVRRALASRKNILEKAITVCNRKFKYLEETHSFIALNEYRKSNLKILPVLDKEKRLIRIIDLDRVKAQLPVECMIMAGGRGKRLSPLTDTIPKPMLPLGGKPIIEHTIDRLITFGIKKFYISIKYLGSQIKEYFGNGSSKGIDIEYIWEEKYLGTAGALSLVKNFDTDHILLMNSDLLTNIDFEALYLDLIQSKADMAVASIEHKINIPYAIFETEGQKVNGLEEKPTKIYHANAGIYLLKKELIQNIPINEFYDITSLMKKIIDEGLKLIYSPIIGYWIDIGNPTDYKQAKEFVKHSNLK